MSAREQTAREANTDSPRRLVRCYVSIVRRLVLGCLNDFRITSTLSAFIAPLIMQRMPPLTPSHFMTLIYFCAAGRRRSLVGVASSNGKGMD
ncbi:hypothetical protein EVAR_90774_1 [Eumeta japonica]|uniref:Uncharacterized protein n=1 Tax=Eumeta variegata TaxID=151549 RepID=A0A4C1YET9_EUMVA|nr:hypothetical protein EVAR_90774_1 [Eumeta japonica]